MAIGNWRAASVAVEATYTNNVIDVTKEGVVADGVNDDQPALQALHLLMCRFKGNSSLQVSIGKLGTPTWTSPALTHG